MSEQTEGWSGQLARFGKAVVNEALLPAAEKLIPQGASEVTQALYSSNAYVPYGPTNRPVSMESSGLYGETAEPPASYEAELQKYMTLNPERTQQQSLDAPNLGEDDVILNPFPLVNMASVGGTLLPWLKLGARYVLHHPFTLPTFLRQIAEERVTYTVAPPALLTMLLRQEELLRHSDLSSLRSIGSGSAPLPASMVAGWQDRLGINVLNMFGSNEGVCLLSTAIDFPDPEQRAAYFPRYGAPGVNWSCRAMDQVAIRLVDTTTGEEITRPGQRGEMCIAGPTIFAGYLDGTGDDPFDERGFLRSGDVFELAGDHGQYLKFVDRAGDLINRGGMKIAPAEVEDLLLEHPAVAEAALVGYPDEVLGEKSCAVIVTRPGSQTTPDELLAHLRARHIASYKLPERFEFVESLPHNAIGKVLRRELRDRL